MKNFEVYRTHTDRVDEAYSQQEFEPILRSYAFSRPISDDDSRVATETDIDQTIESYSQAVSVIAKEYGAPDMRVAKAAYERLMDGMNDIANEKFGKQKPASLVELLLFKSGLRKPDSLIYFSRLDDRYWNDGFPREYRETEGPEDTRLARCLARTLHSFALAPFSYIQQASSGHGRLKTG